MSKDACLQGEWSYERLPSEATELRKKLEELLPTYIAAVRTLCGRREEFDRKGCVTWVYALVERVRADYGRWQAARERADLLSKFAVTMVDMALVVARQQPIPPPATPVVLIAIPPSGEIRPALAEEFAGRNDVALLIWESFERQAQKLKQKILQGGVSLNREGQIPGLIHKLTLAEAARGSCAAAPRPPCLEWSTES